MAGDTWLIFCRRWNVCCESVLRVLESKLEAFAPAEGFHVLWGSGSGSARMTPSGGASVGRGLNSLHVIESEAFELGAFF